MWSAKSTSISRIDAAIAKSAICRRDWIGDAVVTLVVAATGLVGILLPWANEPGAGDVNFSLHAMRGVRSALQTPWGLHALLALAAVVIVGALMMCVGPRRITALLGLVIVVCGAVLVISCLAAADAMALMYRPGLGLYVTVLAGILLMPIGIASAMVGGILVRGENDASRTGPTVR
jgi:hypothetical protein